MPPRRVAVALAALLLVVAAPSPARAAGEPIMALAEVHAGMRCTGASVIRGTDISTFDVEVLDVVTGTPPMILVRVSGPAVDASGIAQGFSGSPVRCPDASGTPRIVGAISQGTGDFGNRLVLATPIETMLGEPVDVPAAATPAGRSAAVRAARPLATPLTFGGVSGPVAAALGRAARATGRALYAAPASPRVAFAPQPLVPGASVAVGLASGDISAGAVGTVTYVDGSAVWAFGHPFEGAGRRSLLLQDAYVYTVVANPLDTEESMSYKLASPGHVVGTLTDDAPSAAVGRLGALPQTIPMHVSSTDLDRGRVIRYGLQLADENAIGLPTGSSALTQVGPVAVAQAAYDTLRGSPARQSGEMCVRVALRGHRRPLRFCNRYVGGSPTAVAAPMVADLATALGQLDAYKFGVLQIASVNVNLRLRRDLRQAYLLGASARGSARRGRGLRVRLRAQRVRGARMTRTVTVRVPRDLPTGEQVLTLTGTPADGGGGEQDLASTFTLTLDDEAGADDPGPRSVAALAKAFGANGRDDGVTASFHEPGDGDGETATPEVTVLADPDLRFSGAVSVDVTVRR